MDISLEDEIREAILSVRWRQYGEGVHAAYFERVTPESFVLRGSAASYLAHFIAERVSTYQEQTQSESRKSALHEYSSEDLASYLEDQGYVVSSPDCS
jgi:hypothetical protein